MKLSNNTFMGCDCEYENADIILFSAPFDSTTTFRPGARFAGQAIRNDSNGIESFSPYQNVDLYDLLLSDCGELELPFGNAMRALEVIEENTSKILDDGKVPLMIGGEHLVTYGAVKAVHNKYPDLHIMHFDAHADLRDDFYGERFSHSSVIRRVWDLLGSKKIFQYGIRSGLREEFEFAEFHNTIRYFDFDVIIRDIDALKEVPVYLTIDLDVLDPAFFPGTGTPEPGGVTFKELLDAVLSLKELNIVGCDVVELSPSYDPSGISTAAACKIIRELLMII